MKIVYKKTPELTTQEVDDMEQLALSIDPYLPADYLRNHHLQDAQREYYLVYAGSELIGMQSYKTYQIVTPLHPKAMYVFRGYITYKKVNSGFKNITRTTSIMHMRKYLGFWWMFKRFVALAYSPNPRVYVQFKRFFPVVWPKIDQPTPANIREFLVALLDYGSELNPFLFDQGSDVLPNEVDISQKYPTHFRSRDPKINKFYIKHGVFVPKGEDIVLTNKSLQMVGYYNPGKGIPHLMKQFLGR